MEPRGKRTNGRGMKRKGDLLERRVAAYMSDRLGHDIRRAPLSGGGVWFARSQSMSEGVIGIGRGIRQTPWWGEEQVGVW